MASGNSNDNGGDERNPFVAFRHFADGHISAALSALSDVNADIWKMVENAEGDAQKAWKKFNHSYERATSPERRQTERGGDDRPIPTSSSTDITRKHEDWTARTEERDLPWAGWGAEHWPAMRFGFDRIFDRPGPWRPSLEFLARNRYSPLVLEQKYPTEQQGSKWRSAFEDLLKTETGEASANEEMKDLVDKKEQPEDWLRRMISKDLVTIRRDPWFWNDERHPGGWGRGFGHGFHGPPWHSSRRNVDEEGRKHEKQVDTELDLYEHFLGDRSSTPAHQIQTKLENEVQPQVASDNKPSVVATMTTTEQRMLPDGTVTTKTVLKKRFSDGTEESQETSNTIPGVGQREKPGATMPQVVEKAVVNEKAAVKEVTEVKEVEKAKEKKKTNWFWS